MADGRTTKDLAWLAGLFEGEGWFIPYRGPAKAHALGIAMTDEDVIRRAQAVAGVGRVNGPYGNRRNKPIWNFRVQRNEDVLGLAMTLYPLLGSRRQSQARAMLESAKAAPLPPRLKTHCKHGHEFTEDSLVRHLLPSRNCRTCKNQRSMLAKRKARQRAVAGRMEAA